MKADKPWRLVVLLNQIADTLRTVECVQGHRHAEMSTPGFITQTMAKEVAAAIGTTGYRVYI